MTNSIVPFEFDSNAVRVIEIEGEFWFVLADVLVAMGSKSDPSTTKVNLQEDLGKDTFNKCTLDTNGGTQDVLIINEMALTYLVSRSRTKAGKALNKWIHKEVLPTLRKTGTYSIVKPKTALELAREQVKLLEQLELLEAEKKLLEQENQHLAETVDELFDYSSIVRIAIYNGVNETIFSWRRLKVASDKLSLEIKKVPCPRFVTKNLYSHDAWRLAYPEYKLPETTTLVIN